MIIRFTASNIVAMILFIPLLVAVGLILAFIVPLLAIMVAAAGILFLSSYTFVRIGLVKPKSSGTRLGPVDASRLGKQRVEIGSGGERHSGIPHKIMPTVEVKDYRIR